MRYLSFCCVCSLVVLVSLLVPGPGAAQLEIPTEVPVNRPKPKRTEEPPSLPAPIRADTSTQGSRVRTVTTQESGMNMDGFSVDYPSSARVGERVFVRINAKNPFNVSYIGTIAASIEGGDPYIPPGDGAYDVLTPNGKTKMARFYKDGNVWLRRDVVYPAVTHVEVYDERWAGNTEKTLAFPVTFQRVGTASLRVRASFSVLRDKKTVVEHNIPDTSPELDEQGFPCRLLTIRVVE